MKRKINKRLARLCLCLLLVYLFVPVLSLPVHAEEESWMLQKVLVETNPKERQGVESLEYEGDGSFVLHAFLESDTSDMAITVRASHPPKTLRPGDDLTIDFLFDIQTNLTLSYNCYRFWSEGGIERYRAPEGLELQSCDDYKGDASGLYISLESDDSVHPPGIYIGNASEFETYGRLYGGSDIFRTGSRLSATVPESHSDTNLLIVRVDYYANLSDMWPNAYPVVREMYAYTRTGSTGQTVIGETGNTGSDDQEIIVDAGNESGEIGETIDSGIIDPGADHDRPDDDSGWTGDDGDDGGGNIAGTIAKVGGGAVAVAIGVKAIKGLSGKSGGKKKKKKKKKKREEGSGDDPQDEPQEEQKDEKKRYEMRVYKEFGDTIYVGRPVTLGARIVEISASGAERTVPELTNQITISSSYYLQVGGTFPSGQYQSARITAPDRDGTPPSTATVTFCLVAPGGSFTQHMRFRIKQADPMVVWPDLPCGIDHYLDTIAGDNTTYRVRFFFQDVSEEPEKIVFGQYDNYEITVEPADTMYTYWAAIKNRTAPLDNHTIYQNRSSYPREDVGFTATFKDGLVMEDSITIIRYPEGLSVIAELENGRIPVRAYEKEEYTEWGYKYHVTPLSYICTRRTQDGAEVFQPENGYLRYGRLQGDKDEKDNNVAIKYKFDVDSYGFVPLETLYEPTPGATYSMKLDVVWREDPDNVLTLPFIFKLKPKSPMQEWQKEFDKLKENVTRFSLPEKRQPNIERLEPLTPANISVAELRLMSEAVRHAYIEYWENEYNRQMNIDARLEWWVDTLGWVKFAGDCAFSYLIYYFATTCNCTTAAPYIDAIGSAGKDIFCSLGGRYIGAWWSGEELYLDGFVKECTEAAKTALDDCIFEMIPDNPKAFFKSPSIKKVGTVVSAYMLVNFAMNLTKIRYDMDDPEEKAKLADMTEEDRLKETSWSNSVYAALIASFKDMSLRMITSIVGNSIEKYLENPDIRKKIGKFIISIFDLWWKGEKKLRLASHSTQKWISRFSAQLYQFRALRSERLDKLAHGLKNCRSLYERSQSFNAWKEKAARQVTEILDKIPEEQFAEAASMFFGKKEMKNYVLSKKGNLLPKSMVPEKAMQGGVIMDKIISKGAGYVYDLSTGEVVGLKEDFNMENEAVVAAGEMDEKVMDKRVQTKRAEKQAEELRAVVGKLTADIKNAETPEEVENMIDQFLGKFGLPEDVADVEEEEADDDYVFDSAPDFKVGSDGRMYVVMILRKPGTQQGYRIEYNMNKVFADGLDNEVFVEFFKLFFGGVLPDFPEKKAPTPSDPPLPRELR